MKKKGFENWPSIIRWVVMALFAVLALIVARRIGQLLQPLFRIFTGGRTSIEENNEIDQKIQSQIKGSPVVDTNNKRFTADRISSDASSIASSLGTLGLQSYYQFWEDEAAVLAVLRFHTKKSFDLLKTKYEVLTKRSLVTDLSAYLSKSQLESISHLLY